MPQVNVLGCCKLVLLPVVYGCALGTITSLIPRPFPPPAFHCLQSASTVCKYGGGRPGRSGHMQCHQVHRGTAHGAVNNKEV